ncbi:AraC family transcriptional regulator [Occallatibacter riparius]|uniref:AraC family transcriptional regulator n=1 Tax=Occallatibacter riparius TaxID=1002689 RepID=A0A9J7BRW0_9BACT|nr:AraC family transcriptional regulator [Occallatibacter riparius]UWZ85303.1 AraC family transcriptional regulator [Occallatibacter riparius]
MSPISQRSTTAASIVPASADLGTRNCVLGARARRHSVREFPGPLSIKCVTSGRVAWRVGRRDVWVDPSCFLVLNASEPYSMDIDSAEPVTTCCAFFAPGFVEGIFRDGTRADAHCLDDPGRTGSGALFLARLRPINSGIARVMTELESQARSGGDGMRAEELYNALAWQLLELCEETRRQIGSIPAARASTRAELLSRVSRGRELLHASSEAPPSLAEAARAAAMSPFHFQRTFQRAFGISPAGYQARLRFERATALLRRGVAVTEAALDAHYSGTAAFSTAFRKRFGVTPSHYAAQFSNKSKAAAGNSA